MLESGNKIVLPEVFKHDDGYFVVRFCSADDKIPSVARESVAREMPKNFPPVPGATYVEVEENAPGTKKMIRQKGE